MNMNANVWLRGNKFPLLYENIRNHWIKDGMLIIVTEDDRRVTYAPFVWEILEID